MVSRKHSEIAQRSLIKPVSLWFVGMLTRLHISEVLILITPSRIVGMWTGLGAVAFRYLNLAVEWVGYDWFPTIFSWVSSFYIVMVPAVGGLLVGFLNYSFARVAKGHGVPVVMKAASWFPSKDFQAAVKLPL